MADDQRLWPPPNSGPLPRAFAGLASPWLCLLWFLAPAGNGSLRRPDLFRTFLTEVLFLGFISISDRMKSKERIKRWADYWDENPQNREKHICEEEKVTLGHSLGFFPSRRDSGSPFHVLLSPPPFLRLWFSFPISLKMKKEGKIFFLSLSSSLAKFRSFFHALISELPGKLWLGPATMGVDLL